MPRKTPMEALIALQTDRQAQYEKRRRDAGFTKSCVWVPTECVQQLKDMARDWCAKKEADDAADSP